MLAIFFWSLILKYFIEVQEKKKKVVVLGSGPPQNVKLGTFMPWTCNDGKEMLLNKIKQWFGGSTSTKWFFVYLIPGRIGIWKCCFLRRGENRSTRRKTSRSKGENQQQTQPTYGVDARIWTRATLVGGQRSHHCVIPWSPKCTKTRDIRAKLWFC